MNVSRTARERVRAELTREITDIARTHLADRGAAALSLRAVARDAGMVSSAIHRYFPTKDDLLTALIIDGYNAVGAAVEQADRDPDPADHRGRWLAIAGALRGWALQHPHEYALVYGSPVPGYAAPQDTIPPAARAPRAFGAMLTHAHTAGRLDAPADDVPKELAHDVERLRVMMPGLPAPAVARAVTCWTALFGWISFELFGQFENTVDHRAAAFDLHARTLAGLLGLRQAAET